MPVRTLLRASDGERVRALAAALLVPTLVDEQKNKSDLISLLAEKRALLMVGVGSSAFVDYPIWGQLLAELRQEFAPGLVLTDTASNTTLADQIKKQADTDNRIQDYYKFLERTFQPKGTGVSHHDFHSLLVQLGFSGVVTLNYDCVMESAMWEVASAAGHHGMPEAIDLCSRSRPYRVFDFLRSLGHADCLRCVLHLHGCYDNPQGIILTRQDYRVAYGELREKSDAISEDGTSARVLAALSSAPLDTIHRKVIWALLAIHPVVFVGFGMEDEFFLDTLKIVQQDFALSSDRVHFALVSYSDDHEKGDVTDELRRRGVQPVFYFLPETKTPSGNPDHRGLVALVSELARSVDVPTRSPSIDDLNKKMWSYVRDNPTR